MRADAQEIFPGRKRHRVHRDTPVHVDITRCPRVLGVKWQTMERSILWWYRILNFCHDAFHDVLVATRQAPSILVGIWENEAVFNHGKI